MKKILIVINTRFVPFGGLTSVMMNYFRAMNKEDLQIDFASTNNPPDELLKELQEAGSRYYNLGRRKNIPQYILHLFRLIRKNQYDVIHINGNSASMVLDLLPASWLRTPFRIAHTHSMNTMHSFLHQMFRPLIKKVSNCYLAASDDAGRWLFDDGYVVLKNAIDVQKYQYSQSNRKKVRLEWGIKDQFVVGTVGKLNSEKNQMFLIRVFAQIVKKREDAILIIAGGGPLENELKLECKRLGITKSVLFLGMITNVETVLQGFDVFVFPSIFEGFGMVVLEALASGLKCYVSDSIPKASNVTGTVRYLKLSESVEIWAEQILNTVDYDRENESENAMNAITSHGYNIFHEAGTLRNIYMSTKQIKWSRGHNSD